MHTHTCPRMPTHPRTHLGDVGGLVAGVAALAARLSKAQDLALHLVEVRHVVVRRHEKLGHGKEEEVHTPMDQ